MFFFGRQIVLSMFLVYCLTNDGVRSEYDHPSNYIEPQDMGVPRSRTEVPHFFGNMPRSEAPVKVYSGGYRVEQEFHTPERSYGFGVEEKRVLERSTVPRSDDTPIVVERPFEGRTEIFPLTGRTIFYRAAPLPALAWSTEPPASSLPSDSRKPATPYLS